MTKRIIPVYTFQNVDINIKNNEKINEYFY